MEVKGWARWNGQHDDVELVVDVEDDATEDQIDEALRGAAFEASFLEYGRLTASIDLAGEFDEEEARKILAGVGPEKQLQIEPGLREIAEWLWKLQADYLSAGAYQERETVLYITDELLKRIGITETDIAADIAAQGGQVVDHSRLVERIKLAMGNARTASLAPGLPDTDYRHQIGAHEALAALLGELLRGDFNSAVPSAPGGPSTLQAAWDEFDKQLIPVTFTPELRTAYTRLREVLGHPQGSDSLRWARDTPIAEGWYWRRYPDSRTVDCVWYGLRRSHHTKMTFRTVGGPVDNMEGFEFAGPIPEPAQPVDAGEAQERGDNE